MLIRCSFVAKNNNPLVHDFPIQIEFLAQRFHYQLLKIL